MPRSLKSDLPEPFERVLLKALAKERNDRYASVTDMLAALEKAAAESAPVISTIAAPAKLSEPAAVAAAPSQASQPAAPKAPAKKPKRIVWIAALGAIALALLCVAAVVLGGIRNRVPLQKARQLRDQGMIDQALLEYAAVAKANPRQTAAYSEPAEMLMERGQPGDFVRAAQICEAGLKVEPDNAQLHTAVVYAYFASNDLEIAVPHLEWLIKNRPGDALPHAGMALVMAQKGQLDAAQREAEAVLDRDKDSLEGHLALGVIYMKRGQPQQAREEFRFVMNTPVAPRWLKDRVQQLLNEIRP